MTHSLARLVWGILITCVLLALPAFAQDPIVTAADPPSAEQETYDLDVMVSGDNFGTDSTVDFFVTGTTNPGGIHVKNVKRQGPKTLKVTIDVDADAVLDDFDIQVMSRGRTGKGIELFRVIEKEHPVQDTTPPGVPENLQVIEPGYGFVTLSFTMPADDFDDPASGPVIYCPVSVTPPGSYWMNDWPWGQPGEEELVTLDHLEPGTDYLFTIRCFDDGGNNSELSLDWETSQFLRDPSWTIDEVPIDLHDLIGHRIDPSRNVVIAGLMGVWQRKGRRNPELQSSAIRIITGSWDDGSGGWSWTFEDVPGVASRLEIDPAGNPAFVGARLLDSRPHYSYQMLYTFRDGTDWTTDIVAEVDSGDPPGFAFDPSGHPAIAWCAASPPQGLRLARRDAAGQWSVENVNAAACDEPGAQPELAFDDSGNPAIAWVHQGVPDETRFTLWTAGGWTEEALPIAPIDGGVPSPKLVYDPVRADFTAVGAWWGWVWSCDRFGAAGWQCQPALPFGFASFASGDLTADPAGELWLQVLTHNGACGAAVARRLPGASVWTVEHVDHPSTRGFSPPFDYDQWGPHLALDWDSYARPTLTWAWGHGGEPPSEFHLYFAWKP
jgi:hypothetical protein